MSQVKVYYCDKNDLCEELTTSCGAIHAVVLASDFDKLEAKLKIARDALEFISENELIMDDMTYCSHAAKALKQLEEN